MLVYTTTNVQNRHTLVMVNTKTMYMMCTRIVLQRSAIIWRYMCTYHHRDQTARPPPRPDLLTMPTATASTSGAVSPTRGQRDMPMHTEPCASSSTHDLASMLQMLEATNLQATPCHDEAILRASLRKRATSGHTVRQCTIRYICVQEQSKVRPI